MRWMKKGDGLALLASGGDTVYRWDVHRLFLEVVIPAYLPCSALENALFWART